ncbi:alpha/beta fold hydrolase [Jatrophihabitans sp.]|jgi:pimeloyl-ACP methyl ester carboxylesterase|uniref:alpha/beta fold hydrolase n=1 Tax=Jatrophihabitans sp. TaxID=1932789 RepID=UPI002EFB6C44
MKSQNQTHRSPAALVNLRQAAIGGLAALLLVVGLSGVGAHAASSAPARTEPLQGKALFDSSFTHGTVETEGGYLHYVKGGSGPALVLLHGWPETWWEWRHVMPALARNHTVIAFDLPGLGQSSIPEAGYEMTTAAARLHEATNRLGYRKVELMGHDMSVLIAYDWARDYPREVTRLAVLDSTLPGFGLEDVYTLSYHFGLNMAPAPIPEEVVDDDDVSTYLNGVFVFAKVPEAIDREYYTNAYLDPARRSAAYNYYRHFAAAAEDNKANAVAKRLTQPVLAMGAEFLFGAGVGTSFENVAGDVRTVVAPGAGHWIQEETPQFVIDCASLFFGPSGGRAPAGPLANCAA